MKRVVLVILGLVLAAATGFLVGHYTRPIPPAPPAPAAAAEAGPPEEPAFEIIGEGGGIEESPLVNLMGVSRIWRYQHGPAWIHVEYFVDFEQDGVKKRAFFQAFNIGDDESQGTQWARAVQALNTDGYYDLAKSQGAIVLDKDLGLRTQRIYQVSGHDPDTKTGAITSGTFRGASSWDVFERYQQASMEPPPALVLDYDQYEKSGKNASPSFQKEWSGEINSPQYTATVDRGRYAGRDGAAVLMVQILPMPNKAAATEETAEAEVAKLRTELTATPDGAELKGKLARALDYKRLFLKERTPEKEYALAEEAAKFMREATKQAPGNMILRAELRGLLLRQAALMTEGKHASEFPKTLEEMESLVPLYDSEYTEAAGLLVKWKNPELDKDLPENDKKRITQETDAKVVTLLRRHAEIWQNRPDAIKKKLQAYEKDAMGKSYANTAEFKGLLEEMRGWVMKKD